ncbi:MAG: NifU family protein [bacterium]
MEEKIKTILERDVVPILASHGGGCEFVELTPNNIVKVKLTGMCCGCRGAKASIKGVVEGILKENIEGIKAVEEI